ncbi:MraY family glycosyltransferase [Carboxydochorda subterranea]|uniref:MraY family glycosyltransferase n=1 Tax=Carboxydichorda subterranea TaxID=3109565 RepID=A0ABZ1BVX5_9FIRM|nr:MraY family glycosyltransferase [Limnochorda sp. L945t]WRP16937.1 MraY family glycosyltransferase [Limnochorda sp. L945t]
MGVDMDYLSATAAAAAAFLLVWVLTPAVERWARARGLLDRPEGRHLHPKPVPRLGGIALFLGWVAGGAVLWMLGEPSSMLLRVGAGVVIIFAVGLIDDLRTLTPRAKLAGQLLAAGVSVALGLRIEFLSLPSFIGGPHGLEQIVYLGPWSVPITLLWLVGVTNAVNLLDGLDGLAAGVVAIAAVPTLLAAASRGLADPAALLMVLAAGCVAFLRYNFSPARIFMGDSGALTLGFAFAAASALGSAKGPAVLAMLVPVLSLGVPLFDTAWAVVRRSMARRPLGEADNGHLHYRLLARWQAPRQVVLALYGVSAALGSLALLVTPQSRMSLVPPLGLLAVAAMMIVRVAWDQRSRPHRVEGEGWADGRSGGHADLRHPARGHQARARYQGS